MRVRGFLGIATALLLGLAAVAAQQPLETRGAWQLVADGSDFALRTPAIGAADTTLSLNCRKEKRSYAFEIKSPALAARASGEDIRIGFKVDDDDRTWFNLATSPEGTVPISHQPPSGSSMRRSRAAARSALRSWLPTMTGSFPSRA
jgi:hypothetical protein